MPQHITPEAVEQTATAPAAFSQLRNDLYWSFYAGDDGRITFTGYDDDFWWDNVCPKTEWRTRIGKVTGRTFFLDPHDCKVTIYPARGEAA